VVNNLLEEVGLNMTEKDGSDGTKLHHYEDKLVELKP
jgi:hypothetical protein